MYGNQWMRLYHRIGTSILLMHIKSSRMRELFLLCKDVCKDIFHLFSFLSKGRVVHPLIKVTMIELDSFFNSFFIKSHISLDIPLFKEENIIFIQTINKRYYLFPLFWRMCLNKLDNSRISLCLWNSCYRILILIHIHLHSTILDIVPVSNKVTLKSKLIKKFLPSTK